MKKTKSNYTKTDMGDSRILQIISTELCIHASGQHVPIKDLIDKAKKNLGYKIITKKRWPIIVKEAYFIGRDGIELEKKNPSLFDLIPKVESFGLGIKYKRKTK